jgi:hypothetical protein
MQTTTTLASSACDLAAVVSALLPAGRGAPPGSDRSERLLARYEPDPVPEPAYFACSATAAEIARTRGTGRLTYAAI